MTTAYDIERVQVLCVEIESAIAKALEHFCEDDPSLSCWHDAFRAVARLEQKITVDKLKKQSEDALKIDYATGGRNEARQN